MLSPISNRDMIDITRQQKLAQALNKTQVQIATGKRLARGSEDPLATARIATLKVGQQNQAAWQVNLDRGLSANNAASAAAQSLADNLGNAREMLLAGSSGTASAADRETYARQLDGIATAIDRLAAQRDAGGEPLFRSDGAIMVRYAADVVLAPVPARDDVFAVGGVPIATMVRNAAAALRAGGPTNVALDQLDSAIGYVSDSLARIGQTGSALEKLRELSTSQQVELAAERSALEDTDLSEAIARLNVETLTLEAAQSAFARINRRTLFDILG